MIKFLEKMLGWLPRRDDRSARAQPGVPGLEYDIVRGVVHQTRGRPFAEANPIYCRTQSRWRESE